MYGGASETPHPYGAPARHSLVSELQSKICSPDWVVRMEPPRGGIPPPARFRFRSSSAGTLLHPYAPVRLRTTGDRVEATAGFSARSEVVRLQSHDRGG